MLVLYNDSLEVWEQLLKSGDIVLRDLALRKVFRLTKERFEPELINIYSSDISFNVRMHALKYLAELNDKAFRQILIKSINDPYEFIRRKSAELMGDIGDTSYLTILAHTILTDESDRVSLSGIISMEFLGALSSLWVIESTLSEKPGNVSSEKLKNLMNTYFRRSDEWLNMELIPQIFSDTLKLKSRLSQIRTFRNYRFNNGIPELIRLALMKRENIFVRVNTLETLGCYFYSLQKNNILWACDVIINDKTNPDELIQEAIRTKNRLINGSD